MLHIKNMKLGIGGNTLAFVCLAVRSVAHHCSSDVASVAFDLVDGIAEGIIITDDLASGEIPSLKANGEGVRRADGESVE